MVVVVVIVVGDFCRATTHLVTSVMRTCAMVAVVLLVQDVAWHRHHSDLFASVGDDRRLLLYVAVSAICHSLFFLLFMRLERAGKDVLPIVIFPGSFSPCADGTFETPVTNPGATKSPMTAA